MKTVTISLNTAATERRILDCAKKAQSAVADFAFKSSSLLCKKDTGRLAASGRVDKLSGLMSWNTEYARAAYFTGDAKRDKNPLASKMWAHRAASLFAARWLEVVRREFK